MQFSRHQPLLIHRGKTMQGGSTCHHWRPSERHGSQLQCPGPIVVSSECMLQSGLSDCCGVGQGRLYQSLGVQTTGAHFVCEICDFSRSSTMPLAPWNQTFGFTPARPSRHICFAGAR